MLGMLAVRVRATAVLMLGALMLTVLAPAAALADITSVRDEVHEEDPPSSVVLNQHQHADTGPRGGGPYGASAFNEEQGYVSTSAIALDVCIPGNPSFAVCQPNARAGRYDRATDLVGRGGTVPANTCIDSHLVHADPPGTSGFVYDGEVNFDGTILGVIVTSANLIASDAGPGLSPTTTYGTEPTRGLEFGPTGQLDHIIVNVNANTNRVTFHFDTTVNASLELDQIRVITMADTASCPGQAETLTLTPKVAVNEVGSEHCVVASVKNAIGGPATGITVRFDVTGASEDADASSSPDGATATDADGNAEHCYDGPTTPGADAISAYADNDDDGTQDVPTDPADSATKTWNVTDANTIDLEPQADQNPVGTEHCVTATVKDVFGNPVPDEWVRFEVVGDDTRRHAEQTDEQGQAEYCYTRQDVRVDTIRAYADEDNDQQEDATEPFDVAAKAWTPGRPASLVLTPKVAENRVTEEHCVTATVRDEFANLVPGVNVYFDVTGVNDQDGARQTDDDGQARYCYTGGQQAGADVIAAFVDEDNNQTPDPLGPADTATKTWLPLEPAFLTLTPKEGRNTVGDEHCVQAAVTDIFLNPNPGETVYFVVTGTVDRSAADETDAGGIAEFCYTSTTAGVDNIHAFVDTNDNGVEDEDPVQEPRDDATKTWAPDRPATLTLSPKSDENEVGTEHCVQADVRDQFGNPTPNVWVDFDVEGASETDGQPQDEDGRATTDEFGKVAHCYTGPDLPGSDVITAYADTNNNRVQDRSSDPEQDEPAQDTASKTWIFPASTAGCEITIHDGGWILTSTGSKGTFGGNARIEQASQTVAMAETDGELQYTDHAGVGVSFHSEEIVSVVCSSDQGGQRADVYGTGRLEGAPVAFRVRVSDRGEPGSQPLGPDTYQLLATGYVSGPDDNPLQGGNIQIHTR